MLDRPPQSRGVKERKQDDENTTTFSRTTCGSPPPWKGPPQVWRRPSSKGRGKARRHAEEERGRVMTTHTLIFNGELTDDQREYAKDKGFTTTNNLTFTKTFDGDVTGFHDAYEASGDLIFELKGKTSSDVTMSFIEQPEDGEQQTIWFDALNAKEGRDHER
ncbi:MAG: hypothetical protein J4F41_09485 [Alphaproteobacteria bacterium]|nr:hypothetical protein [Alphaproteobacteria bacterium]